MSVSVEVGSVSVPVLLIVAMTGEVSVLLVRVCVESVPTKVVVADGIVKTLEPVPAKVTVLEPVVAKVEPSATVRVEPVAGAVIVTLFTVVAVATPKLGVVKVGEVRVLLVRVCVAPRVTTVSDELGKVIVVASVPAKVSEFDIFNFLPDVTTSP